MSIINKFWDVTSRDQFRAVDELVKGAQPSATYQTLLVLSSLVITAGVILGSVAILIGGMLITPLLSPILVIALGLVVGKSDVTFDAIRLVVKSFVFILVSAIVLGILFGTPKEYLLSGTDMSHTLLYLIIAISSGIAATYAWVKKEASVALPGVAIAVSLVPPIAFIGVALAGFDFAIARDYFVIVLVNVIGVIGGSMLVFSQFGFYRTRHVVEKKNNELEQERKEKKEELKAEKIADENAASL